MNLYQTMWLVFVFGGMYFLLFTKWSSKGDWLLKLLASLFVSGCFSLVLFVVVNIWEWLA